MKKYARLVKDHLWGPTGSLLFHMLVLALLVRFLAFERLQEETATTFFMDIVTPDKPLDKILEEFPEIDDETPSIVPEIPIPIHTTESEPPIIDPPETTTGIDPYQTPVMRDPSPIMIPNMFTGRFGEERERALRRYGPDTWMITEVAVLQALDWLKDHQYPDGSWGPHYRAAMSGLAILAFLSHGETTGSPEYGDTVRAGLQYLVGRQNDRGWILGGGPHVHGPQLRVYEHVIATYALAEAYAMTKIPMIKPSLEDAVQVILDGQLENGGWAYDFQREGPMHIDVSLGGWVIQALKAAELSGAENRGIAMAIANGVRAIRVMSDPSGGGLFAYSSRLPQHLPDHSMTGVAVLAMQLTGHIGTEEARMGMRALRSLNFRWQDERGTEDRMAVGRWPLYAWYYITQARFQHNINSWRPWNSGFAPGMSSMQNPDGSWCPPADSVENVYGPVYATALPALTLQVYYRLLPTYQPVPLDEALTLSDSGYDIITIHFE